MVFCFESDMVSVFIVDDAQRGTSEGTRVCAPTPATSYWANDSTALQHKAGLALAIIAIIIGILVLLSPCIK